MTDDVLLPSRVFEPQDSLGLSCCWCWAGKLGAVRYECSAEPIMMFKCHCRDCQRVTGDGFVPGLAVPSSAFRVTKGQLRYHFTPSTAGGKPKRGFCSKCGSCSPVESQMNETLALLE